MFELHNDIVNGNIKNIKKVIKYDQQRIYDVLLDTIEVSCCNNMNKFIFKRLRLKLKNYYNLAFYAIFSSNYEMFKYISKKCPYLHYNMMFKINFKLDLYTHLCKLGRKLYIRKYPEDTIYNIFNTEKFVFMLQTLI